MGTLDTASGTASYLLLQNMQGAWGCTLLQMWVSISSQKSSISSGNNHSD